MRLSYLLASAVATRRCIRPTHPSPASLGYLESRSLRPIIDEVILEVRHQ